MSQLARRRSTVARFWTFGLVLALVSVLVGGCGQMSGTSAYPTKPVEAVVAFAAGGSSDLLTRHLAPYLQQKWGQPISVVNRPGAGGATGTVSVLQSSPDGYTVGMFGDSNGFLNHAVQKDVPYQWDSINHIVHIAAQPYVLVVKGDSKYNSVADLAADIQKDPSALSYGTSGVAGPSTFAAARLAEAAGVDPTKLRRVPFDGGAPTVAAVAGGHVDFATQNLGEVLQLTRGGQLKALAVTLPERWKDLPDVPTFKEAGYESVRLAGTFGVYGPANLPADVVKRWEDTVAEVLKDPQFVAGLERIGASPAYLNSKDFRAWIESEYKTSLAIAEKLDLRR